MAITTVQSSSTTSSSSYSDTIQTVFSSNVTSGNMMVAVISSTVDTGVSSPGGNVVSSVTDNFFNTWLKAASIMGNNNCAQEIWYCPGLTGGVSYEITVTFSQSVWSNLLAREYSGIEPVSPLDGYSSSASGSSTTTFLTGDTIAPSQVGDLVIAACSVEELADISEQSSTGYGSGYSTNANPELLTVTLFDKVADTAYAQDASFLSTVSAYGVSQVANFLAAPDAGTSQAMLMAFFDY
jgi:hypothetical protein